MKSSMERTYSLGQYQNIKIYSEIEGDFTPLELELNKRIQFLDLELTYLDYVSMLKQSEHLSFEDRFEYLTEMRQTIVQQLVDLNAEIEGE